MTIPSPGARTLAAPPPRGADLSTSTWHALRTGDPDALTEIYRDNSEAVFGFAFRRTASIGTAEDATQAAFTTIWRLAREGRLPALELPTPLPYLLRITANECRNLDRSQRRRLALTSKALTLRDTHDTPDHVDSLATRLDDERRMSDVRRALATLPRPQQEVIEVVIWSGLSIAQAATVLGVAEGTVKSRLSRARHRLGDLLAAPVKEIDR